MISTTTATATRSVVVESVVDLCTFVDDLPPEATGELVVVGRGATHDGTVFVEGGRVCWAAARGLSRRLSDLLATAARLAPSEMEDLYVTCKKQQVPLGEHLVSSELISGTSLRSILLEHTAESLHALCGPSRLGMWSARRSGGYCSRFTFSTTELLAKTLARADDLVAQRARDELAEAFVEHDWAAAFARTAARASPEPIAMFGTCPDTMDSLLRLGRWACSSLDVTGLVHDDHAFVATVFDDTALVAWKVGDLTVAGRTSVLGPARLLNRRARARRSGGHHGDI